MKSRVIQLSAIATLALALGLGAAPANAAQGSFNVPFELHWGQAILEPGQYHIHYDMAGSGFQIFTVSGNGQTRFVVPFVAQTQRRPASSCLRIQRIGDAYYVREFDSELSGRNYSFWIPKAARRLSMGRADGTSLLTIAVGTTR